MTPHEIEWVRPSPAYGGALKPLFAGAGRVRELAEETVTLPSWNLTPRQVCDIELLLNGAYSPLGGFMEQGAYESVCANMRLADGTLWPMPITLDVSEQFAGSLSPGDRVALRHPRDASSPC